MESPKEAADYSASNFSKVVFQDIPHSYPPSTSVTCCYTLTASFQPNSRDWVGIFKVGWSTTKDYHTFVWVEPCQDVVQQSVTRQAVFKDYYLPKDEIEFYQFCYVDSTGQVRGASTPFCFRNAAGTSLESSPDDDLLVITTQEQVDQSVRERAELQRELDQIMAENEALKGAVRQGQQEAATLKEQNEQKEKENSQLVKELDQMKEQNKNVNSVLEQQQKEIDQLKEEMSKTKQQHDETEQKKRSQSLCEDSAVRQKEEKYDRAVMKINQLKAEREELRGRADVQSVEITTLNSKLREQDRELLKMKDSNQLLKVDLQSSESEKGRLSADLQRLKSFTDNMDDLKKENQELMRRLSQLETLQSSPDDDLRVGYQTLSSKLQDTQAKLVAEKEESRTAKLRSETLEKELQEVKEQLVKVKRSYDEVQLTADKLKLMLREAREQIEDKDGITKENEYMMKLERQEKEELAREIESLIRDIEGLRRLNAELQAAPPVDPLQTHPDPSPPSYTPSTTYERQQPGTPEQEEHPYETIGSVEPEPEEEQSLVCRHCQESFPGITQHELEQHEQSHKICPLCTMICDNMDQSVFEDHVYGHEL